MIDFSPELNYWLQVYSSLGIKFSFIFKVGEVTKSQVTDLTAKFRDKFFQATLLTKEERASMKSLFPRDKRGQGLAYRLEEGKNRSKVIKMDGALECESSGVIEEKNSEALSPTENLQGSVSGN